MVPDLSSLEGALPMLRSIRFTFQRLYVPLDGDLAGMLPIHQILSTLTTPTHCPLCAATRMTHHLDGYPCAGALVAPDVNV